MSEQGRRKGPPAFGERIRRTRKGRAMTLEALATASGVSKSVLSEIERGRTNPTLATLWNIGEALGLDPRELLGGNDGETTAAGRRERIETAATPVIESPAGRHRLVILSDPRLVGRAELYRLELAAGGCLDSQPHEHGAVEQVTVISGKVEVRSGDAVDSVAAGSTVRYPADMPHRITALGSKGADVLLFVTFDE